MEKFKSNLLRKQQVIQYAKIAIEILKNEGEENYQKKIQQNGYHPELKKYFQMFFPEADIKS